MSFIPSKQQARLRIAQEAARIIVEEGIQDFLIAKQKAASRLRINTKTDLPRNEAIETALADYHQLYRSSTQPIHLKQLRRIALEAMEFFQAYSPTLIGSVLEGYAGDHSPIVLHLFSDTSEDILIKMLDANIPCTETYHTMATDLFIKHKPSEHEYPAFHFIMNETHIQLKLLPIQLKNLFREEYSQGSIKAVRRMLQ